MSPHPSAEQLQQLQEGRLGEVEGAEVEAHVETCKSCQATLDGLPLPAWSLLPFLPRPGQTSDRKTDVPAELPSVPGYEVLGLVGRGGMGLVYKARQHRPPRLVALKLLYPGLLAQSQEAARLRHEAELAARLEHPGITRIYEVGELNGQPYFSMEFIEGENLAGRLAGLQTLTEPAEAARLVQELAGAIHHAHECGIVHRDLKPANVLLPRAGGVKITDFGLAKRLEGEDSLTHSGAIMGTVNYMAPEQAAGQAQQVCAASDVHALGVILYEMLTGQPPFRGTSALETLEQVRNQEPVPPRRVRLRLPRDLETICLKCLQKKPDRRYASARELADDLGRYLQGEPIRARRTGIGEHVYKWVRRRPAVAGLLALLVLAFLAGITGVAWQWRQTETARLEATNRARELEANLYFNRIDLAGRELPAGGGERARELLEECPLRLRHVEWHILRQLVEGAPYLPTLRGHAGGVWSVAFNPDGSRLASASIDGSVKVWDTRTGREVHVIPAVPFFGQNLPVMCVAFSPDGQRLACGTFKHGGFLVSVRDAATGAELLSLPSRDGLVSSVAFSPDGNQLASSTWWLSQQEARIRVWDAMTGKELQALRGHTGPVKGLAFHPDGRRLASASSDGTARIWDLTTAEQLHRLGAHATVVSGVAFSQDGQRLATYSLDGTLKVWDAATGEEQLTLKGHSGPVLDVAFSRDGTGLASGGNDNTVRIWHAETGREIVTLRGHTDTVWSVAFSPDGRLASGSWDRTVCVWGTPPPWGNPSPEVMDFHGHADRVNYVAFSRDGRRLVSAGWDDTVKIWDAATARELFTLRGHTAPVWSAAFSPDGKHLATGSWDRTVKIWDMANGTEVVTHRWHNHLVQSVAYSPDGRFLASSTMDGTVKVWDTQAGREVYSKAGLIFPVLCVTFSSRGEYLALASGDRSVTLLDTATWLPVESQPMKKHTAAIASVTFSPNGRYMASASWDHTVIVWDVAQRKPIRTLYGHADRVSSVAFSPDNRYLATASEDATVRLWDRASGNEAAAPRRHLGAVWSVAFSPDGRRLAAVSSDRAVRVWDISALAAIPEEPAR